MASGICFVSSLPFNFCANLGYPFTPFFSFCSLISIWVLSHANRTTLLHLSVDQGFAFIPGLFPSTGLISQPFKNYTTVLVFLVFCLPGFSSPKREQVAMSLKLLCSACLYRKSQVLRLSFDLGDRLSQSILFLPGLPSYGQWHQRPTLSQFS